jgi:hypothetical protein
LETTSIGIVILTGCWRDSTDSNDNDSYFPSLWFLFDGKTKENAKAKKGTETVIRFTEGMNEWMNDEWMNAADGIRGLGRMVKLRNLNRSNFFRS